MVGMVPSYTVTYNAVYCIPSMAGMVTSYLTEYNAACTVYLAWFGLYLAIQWLTMQHVLYT